MYLGRVMEIADRDELYREPLHPYTKLLLDAAPVPDPTIEKARAPRLIKGELPSPLTPPSGCVFHTRCPLRERRMPGGRPAAARDQARPSRRLHQSLPRWTPCCATSPIVLLLMIPTLIGVAVLIFFMLRVVPGDIVEVKLRGDGGTSPQEVIEA